MKYQLYPLGDQGVIIEFGKGIREETQQQIQRFSAFLDKKKPDWIIEFVPAYTTISIFYDPMLLFSLAKERVLPYEYACTQIRSYIHSLPVEKLSSIREVEIPVCYGEEFGPDLEEVAASNRISVDEVISIHTSGKYIVYMIGFAPGFPYIGGMSEKIATPRRASPRLHIPAGTVGIGGMQTGIYPLETPGGWNLIGRTPIRLFRPEREQPSLLRAGDRIRFTSISTATYRQWEEKKHDND